MDNTEATDLVKIGDEVTRVVGIGREVVTETVRVVALPEDMPKMAVIEVIDSTYTGDRVVAGIGRGGWIARSRAKQAELDAAMPAKIAEAFA